MLLNQKDDTTAMAWFDQDYDKLLCGSQNGSLRLFDLQGSSPIEFNSHNKNRIFAIKVSPFNSSIFASASEDQLRIFDKRKIKHPLFQINCDIQDFEFSNYHSYVIATIHSKEDSELVKFWNINSSSFEALPNSESSGIELKYPFTVQKCPDAISSICWVPRIEIPANDYSNKYLIISENGLLNEYKYKVLTTIPIEFSSSNTLAFTNDNHIFFYDFLNQNLAKLEESTNNHKDGAVDDSEKYEAETDLDDISDLIIRRLGGKYGLDIDHNTTLSEQFSNTGINIVWKWLSAVQEDYKKIATKRMQFNEISPYYKGIANMLGADNEDENK